MEVYLVGGAVRDELLGLPVGERDWVVVGSSPGEMRQLGYRQVGRDFPVFLHPDTGEEYALARTERKQGSGYHGFEVHASPEVSLQDDLKRRDLTINAMAKSLSGEVIDPYGGQRDLSTGHLRHVSAAFAEDPLRILRAARFAARFSGLGFRIADETMRLLHAMVGAGELKDVSRERVWEETRRALATGSPGVYFDVLHRLDAIGQVYAGMADAFFLEPARILALGALANVVPLDDEPCVRFSALIGGLCFHHDEQVRRDVLDLARQPGFPGRCRELLELTVNLQHACHGVLEHDAAALLDLLRRLDGKRRPERFARLMRICSAVHAAAKGQDEYPQAGWLRDAFGRIEAIDTRRCIGTATDGQEVANRLEHARLQVLEEMISERDSP